MPKPRSKENQGLPLRWRVNHNAYHYQIPPNLKTLWNDKRMFRLGTTLNEAYKVWADRLGQETAAKGMALIQSQVRSHEAAIKAGEDIDKKFGV